jgi:hypothetical protein
LQPPTQEQHQSNTHETALSPLALAISTLPAGAAWAVRNLIGTDDGGAIAKAITEGTAIAVSDGSFKDAFGTAALVIEGPDSTNRLESTLVLPGLPKDQSPYRSELGGLFGIVVLVHLICKVHNITSGSIEVGCDGQGALIQALEYAGDVDPSCQQFDIIAAIRFWKTKSPIQWRNRHILGHQDDIQAEHELDRWAQLNCEMDLKAKAHWQQQRTQPHVPLGIHGEPWQLELGGEKVCRNFRSSIVHHIFGPQAQAYWQGKGRFGEGTADEIDWQAVDDGRKTMDRARQHWQTKHNSGFCGVGKMMHRRRERDTPKCPRCDFEVEDTEHVLKCHGTGADDKWKEQHRELKQWLTKAGTDTQIRGAILKGLTAFRDDAEFSSSTPPFRADVQEVVDRQNLFGWRNLLEGFPVVGWAEAQQHAFKRIHSKRTGKRWVAALVKKLADTAWNMWQHRNEVNNNSETSLESIEINDRIRAEYQQGFYHLPKHTKKQTRRSLDDILKAPLGTRKNWLHNISTGRRFVATLAARNLPPPGVSLVEWIRLGRPSERRQIWEQRTAEDR